MRHNNSNNNNNNNAMTIATAIARIWRSKAASGRQEGSNQASEQGQPASAAALWSRRGSNDSPGGSSASSTDSASNIGSRQLNTSQTFYCVIGAGKSVVYTQSGQRSVGGGAEAAASLGKWLLESFCAHFAMAGKSFVCVQWAKVQRQ